MHKTSIRYNFNRKIRLPALELNVVVLLKGKTLIEVHRSESNRDATVVRVWQIPSGDDTFIALIFWFTCVEDGRSQ